MLHLDADGWHKTFYKVTVNTYMNFQLEFWLYNDQLSY